MFAALPHKVQYTNQLQFNLGVPLTTHNLAAQYNQPMPIIIERIGGQHGIPTNFIPKQASGDNMSSRGSVSGDKMEMMSMLAKRDLRNQKLQLQMKSQSSESVSPACSPSRSCLRQKSSYERYAREETKKPRKPLTAKQADKNRRLGAVQTPPPQRPVSYFKSDNSMAYSRNTSMNVTKDSDVYFPGKPIMPEGGPFPKDDVEKLQQEMEGYLLVVEHIMERSISEPGAKFLHPLEKGKRKDEFLVKEEDMGRVRLRIDEQNTRLTRNLYNLRLKVKQVQRDAAHADFSKPTKRGQVVAQLCVVHRGALKALQTFVNQLPHEDLSEGLPHHYQELAMLLKQLTALSAIVRQGKSAEGDGRLLGILDRLNHLNAKCCQDPQKASTTANKKSAVSKDWVSDTKVDKNIFVMKNQPGLRFTIDAIKPVSQPARQNQRQQVQRGRTQKRAPVKENKGSGPANFSGKDRSDLRSAITQLLQPNARNGGKEQQTSGGAAWNVGMGRQPPSQDHRKGYLLPHDLIVKREKAQRAVALSNQDKRYMDPTFAASLKRSPGRPNSAPANVRHKEVNFELDQSSPTPWIPPGRYPRSRSLSSEPNARSRSPFYLHDMSTEDVRYMFPDKQPSQAMKADSTGVPGYGFTSLPTERKLRTADVSNSFIDEVERRLLQRVKCRASGKSGQPPRSGSVPDLSPGKADLPPDHTGVYSDLDETLETTDLVDTTCHSEEARKEAVSAMDAPTIENMKLRLEEMQREQREIRQRWSTLKFTDTQPRSRIFSACEIQSDRFREPPAIAVTGMSQSERYKSTGTRPISNEWGAEPMIFTKPSLNSRVSFHHSVDVTRRNDLQAEPSLAKVKPPKKLLALKQTAVEKISADRDRFQNYLRKRSHHPSGKFDPWKLVEEISDEILSDCLADVAAEVELISEEIADHMYKSEFVVDKSQLEAELDRRQSKTQLDQPLANGARHQPISEGVAYSYDNVESRGVNKLLNRGGNSGKGEVFFELSRNGEQKFNGDRPVSVSRGDQHEFNAGRPVGVGSGHQYEFNAGRPISVTSGGQQRPSSERPVTLTGDGQQKSSPERPVTVTGDGQHRPSAERPINLTGGGQQKSSAERPVTVTGGGQQKPSAERPVTITGGGQQKSSAERPVTVTGGGQQKPSAERPVTITGGGQQSPERPVNVTGLTAPSNQDLLSPERLLPVLSPAEPQLEDVSHLLHREDRSLKREERGGGDVEDGIRGQMESEDDEYEDDYEESSKEADSESESLKDDNGAVGSDDYEDDDFEDVTDSELKRL